MSAKEDDNDEGLSQRVTSIARNAKNNEKKTIEGISTSERQNEVEKEINSIRKAGLQLPPNNSIKCNSFKLTLHSAVKDER